MTDAPVAVWFRHDVRLVDNPAWAAAARSGRPVIPLFVWAPEDEGDWRCGRASRWWLHHSLLALQAELAARDFSLVVLAQPPGQGRPAPGGGGGRGGPAGAGAAHLLRESCRGWRVETVYATARWEPAARTQERQVGEALAEVGASLQLEGGPTLYAVADLRSGSGSTYETFTPFWRACRERLSLPPVEKGIPRARPVGSGVSGADVEGLGLLEAAAGWQPAAAWRPGAAGAAAALEAFLDEGLPTYGTDRDLPDRSGTSRLSPHLRFGEISPAQVAEAVRARAAGAAGLSESAEIFLGELGWRDFSYYLLLHRPTTVVAPLRPAFAAFPWEEDPEGLAAWQQGATGFPLVDAGMRQLRATGWMHNRVRMVVASFLVKDLLLPWQEGSRWFWEGLVDADLANNTMGWQWSAGSGADAAPFFRIFNPVTQGRTHDPQGVYVRRWVPEIARLPARWIHAPWEAPAGELRSAGLALGADYPAPIVDHRAARAAALAAFRLVGERRRERDIGQSRPSGRGSAMGSAAGRDI